MRQTRDKFARVVGRYVKVGVVGPDMLGNIFCMPGFVIRTEDGVQTTAFAVEGDRIVALYAVRNPDKLRHLAS